MNSHGLDQRIARVEQALQMTTDTYAPSWCIVLTDDDGDPREQVEATVASLTAEAQQRRFRAPWGAILSMDTARNTVAVAGVPWRF